MKTEKLSQPSTDSIVLKSVNSDLQIKQGEDIVLLELSELPRLIERLLCIAGEQKIR